MRESRGKSSCYREAGQRRERVVFKGKGSNRRARVSLPEGPGEPHSESTRSRICRGRRYWGPTSTRPRADDRGGGDERGTGMGSTWDHGRGRPESWFYPELTV